MRRLAPGVCLLLLLAFVGARVLAAPAPVTVHFWHAMRGDKQTALNELITEFEKYHPTVHVEARYVHDPRPYGNDYVELYRAILESLARHQPPDVAQVYENWTTQLITGGAAGAQSWIVPAQSFLPPGQSVGDVLPVFLEANTFAGTVWTLPFNKSIYVLYYNKAMLAADHVMPPQTWDDLRSAAQRLTHGGQFGIVYQPDIDVVGHLLYAHGIDYLANHEVTLDSGAGRESLQYWMDLTERDRSALASFDAQRDFVAGKAAMYIFTTSVYNTLTHGGPEVGVAPLPGMGKVAIAGTNLAVFRTTPAQQQASWELVRYLTSAGPNTQWAIRTGYVPVRQSAVESAAYIAFLREHPDFKLAAIDTVATRARVEPRTPGWETIRGIISDAVYAAVSGKETAAEAAHRAAEQSNRLMQSLGGR